jgi:lipoteichoic acid synthase
VIESWSSWQSEYFSVLNNWTPRLDQIAPEYHANKNFHANGFTTNEGLIALLIGYQPIPAVKTYNARAPFQNFWNLKQTLPRMLRKQGY